MTWYSWAHCLVLPSTHSEGWPKVVAEGMCHGVLCVAVDHGQLSTMISGRGILMSSGSPEEIADALGWIVDNRPHYAALTERAAVWARQYSLEGLRGAIASLLADRWGAPVAAQRLLVR
jgi:glycosyltransferase involved in cell wall biosynthesis